MNFKFVQLLLICVLFSKKITKADPNPIVNVLEFEQYLKEKVKFVKNELSESFARNRRDNPNIESVTFKFSKLETVISNAVEFDSLLIGNSMILINSNRSQILMENQIVQVSFEPNLSDDSAHKILFLRGIEYKNQFFLLTALANGVCKIYRLNFQENVWKLNQIITNVQVTSDATFFVFQGKLYLFVLNYNGVNLVPSILYQWMDSYFDETSKRILTMGAIGMSVAVTENGVVFLILQNAEVKSKQTSLVLNFDGEKIRLIHYLNIKNPKKTFAYIIFNSNFMLVFKESSDTAVYRIKDTELIEWFHVSINKSKNSLKLFQASNIQFGIVINQNTVDFYTLDTNKIMKIAEFRVENSDPIIDCEVIENNGFFNLILITKTNQNINIQKSKFKVSLKESENATKLNERLLEKLENIYSSLEKRKPKLQSLANFKSLAIERQSSAVNVQPANLVLDEPPPNMEKLEQLKSRLSASKIKYDQLKNSFNNVFRSDIPQNISGNLVVNGNILIENMTSNQLRVKTINAKPWIPQNWLTQGLTQTISGFVRAKKITSNVMELSNWNKLSDVILLQGNQDFDKPLTINSMFAQNIQTEEINGIPIKKVVVTDSGVPIEGVKTFQQLSTTNLNVINWNKLNLEKPSLSRDFHTFSSDVNVTSINTETINGINWNDFITSIYLKGSHNKIKGSILFNETVTIDNSFNVGQINDFPVSKFFTKSTDQLVSSSLQFRSIKVSNMNCKKVNNISLSEQAVILGEDNLISGPVSAFNVKVKIDLSLRGNHSKFFEFGDHTLGTRSSDLLQVYTSPVTIHGNVFMKNIAFKKDSNIFIAQKQYDPDFNRKYWLKSTDQVITENVKIKSDLSVSDITVEILNGFNFDVYAVNNFDTLFWPLKRTIFYFKKCQVFGNVSFDQFAIIDPFDPRSIAASAIRKDHGSYRLSGPKFFTQPIIVDHLQVDQMNNVTVDEINPHKPNNIIVRNDLIISPNASFNVDKILISESNLKFAPTINMKFLSASNLNIDKLNGHKMDQIIQFLTNQIVLNRLIIENDAYFHQIYAKFIKHFPVSTFAKIVKKMPHIQVHGSKIFTQNVRVNENFQSNQINSVTLSNLMEYGLSRSKPQTITGSYQFDSIKSAALQVDVINGISLSDCFYKNSPQRQVLYVSNFEIESLEVKGFIFANTFNAHPTLRTNSSHSFIELTPLNFASVTIKGDMNLPDDNILENLLRHAVFSGRTNVITGEVYFEQGVIVENITCNDYINDVDITEIISDALFKHRTNQLISGCNTFTEDLYSKGETVIAGNFAVPVVNGIDIEEFDRSLVRKDQKQAVKGHKTFHKGLSANYLKVTAVSWDGNGGGIRPEVLCTYDSDQHFPAAIFTDLSVLNDLYIENLNQVSFSRFLNERIMYSSTQEQHIWGKFHLEHIFIEGSSTIKSINQINIDDLVTDQDTQVINTKLNFYENLVIAGQVKIEQLNNFNLKLSFEDAVFIDEDVTINANVYFAKEIYVDSLSSEYLNKFPIRQINGYLKPKIDFSRPVFQKLNATESLITTGLALTKDISSPFLYVEPFEDIAIPVSSTKVMENVAFGNQTFVSMIEDASGEKCGLGPTCSCPLQYVMQMRLHEDVQFLHGNDFERVFTFRNDKTGIVVNVATNTVSKSSECQKIDGNFDLETTNINWIQSTSSRNEIKPVVYLDTNHIPGYLSDVKFFTSQGSAYLILARYYEPVEDSHELNCLFLELRDSNQAVLVQEIPCVGVSKLELLETYHGIILATANREEDHILTESAIYKFNDNTREFVLLRTVSNSDVSDVCGVNTDDGSFMVFAHRRAPLDIYKYNHKYENYYYYQSLVFDSSVTTVYPFYTLRNDRFDSFLCVALSENMFYIYEYEFIEGFQMKTFGELEHIKALIPYEFGQNVYLLAPVDKYARIFSIVRQGVN